jgi:hypothetical protein
VRRRRLPLGGSSVSAVSGEVSTSDGRASGEGDGEQGGGDAAVKVPTTELARVLAASRLAADFSSAALAAASASAFALSNSAVVYAGRGLGRTVALGGDPSARGVKVIVNGVLVSLQLKRGGELAGGTSVVRAVADGSFVPSVRAERESTCLSTAFSMALGAGVGVGSLSVPGPMFASKGIPHASASTISRLVRLSVGVGALSVPGPRFSFEGVWPALASTVSRLVRLCVGVGSLSVQGPGFLSRGISPASASIVSRLFPLSKRGGGTTARVEVLSAREALTSAAAITNRQLIKKLDISCITDDIRHVGTVEKGER